VATIGEKAWILVKVDLPEFEALDKIDNPSLDIFSSACLTKRRPWASLATN
jgi:hypothetical protein